MERLKVKELKALSKSLGLSGYSKLNKSDLVKLVMGHLNSKPRPTPLPHPHPYLAPHPHLAPGHPSRLDHLPHPQTAA